MPNGPFSSVSCLHMVLKCQVWSTAQPDITLITFVIAGSEVIGTLLNKHPILLSVCFLNYSGLEGGKANAEMQGCETAFRLRAMSTYVGSTGVWTM